MNDYDLLGLMDTYNAMKRDKVQGTPATLTEFLTGITPINDGANLPTQQLSQGNTTYEQGLETVDQRTKTADFVTNQLGVGDSRSGLNHLSKFIPGDRKPKPNHQQAFDEGERLQTRREIGYDK